MPTSPALLDWIDRRARIFDELDEAVTGLAQAAGICGRVVDSHGGVAEANLLALREASAAAARLLGVVDRARRLPPIPDHDTQRHFAAGLAEWTGSAEAVAAATRRGDGAEAARAARALEAGTDDFLRSAVALRRATGQAPDPANPLG